MVIFPIEIVSKIMSYLPIYDKKRSNLLTKIKDAIMVRNVIELYRTLWSRYDHAHSMESLFNDVCRWMNDDVASENFITDKYQKYSSKIFNVPTCEVNTYQKLEVLETRYSSLQLIKLYMNEFESDELKECIDFVTDTPIHI